MGNGYKTNQVFKATITTGSTISSALDLGSDGFESIFIGVPTTTSGSDFYLYGSNDNDTFRKVYFPVCSGTVSPDVVTIGSAATSRIIPIENFAFRYLKIQASAAQTSTALSFEINT